ncbi:hypothetical protein LSAT2_025272 [Lamellibrachia satsuma]|nr:hypothetical protein LSAT2_025272 [Lamellibrachia satsuma]
MTKIYLIYLNCYVVFSLFFLCCHGDLQCYMGTIDKSAGLAIELNNMTCSHEYSNPQIVNRFNNTETVHVPYSLHGREAEATNISHCLVFRYLDGRADFMCDHDDVCPLNGLSGFYHSVTYKGNNGSLYCCKQDLCNEEDVLLNLTVTSTPKQSTEQIVTVPPSTAASNPTSTTSTAPSKSRKTSTRGVTATASPPLTCYHGTNSSVVKRPCQVSHCVTEVTMTAHDIIKVAQYSCDHSDRCHLHGLDDNGCYNDSNHQGLSTRTCCCSQSLCNSGGNLSTQPSNALSTQQTPQNNSTGKQRPLPSHIPGQNINPSKPLRPPPRQQPRSKSTVTLIGGIAGAIFLGLLVIVTIGLVVRRCRHPTSETTYSYTQLTADLAEDEATEDEYMLMG